MSTARQEDPRPFARALITEAVRFIEVPGALEDSAAMRAAGGQALSGASHRDQIDVRARVLGERLGLHGGLTRVRQASPWALLLMAAAMVIAGTLLAGTAIDAQDRRINVLAALFALLGVHVLTLLVWMGSLLLPSAGAGGALAGRLWLQLTARLALGRGAEGAALVQAAMQLLTRARLLPWVAGLVSHGLWILTLSAALATLLFALSFKRYTLGWETTLLAPDTLARLVQGLGVLPGWLGFSVPDTAALAAGSTNSAQHDRLLAWWLIACVTVYGLLPRVLALALCAMVWRARRARATPDLALPYYRQLIARLDALAPPTVVDADTVRHDWNIARHSLAEETQPGWAVVGFELPPELPWPPEPLPQPLLKVTRIAGSAGEREQLLRELSELRPRLLVLACHAASSPDRGTERLVRELLPNCGQCRLWLATQPTPERDSGGSGETPQAQDAPTAPPDNAQPPSPGVERWQRWLAGLGLSEVHCHSDWREATRDIERHPPTP